MINQQRLFKNYDIICKYKEFNNDIRKRIRQAKERYFEKKCKKVKEQQNKNDLFNLHKKVKKLAGDNTGNIERRKNKNIVATKFERRVWMLLRSPLQSQNNHKD